MVKARRSGGKPSFAGGLGGKMYNVFENMQGVREFLKIAKET